MKTTTTFPEFVTIRIKRSKLEELRMLADWQLKESGYDPDSITQALLEIVVIMEDEWAKAYYVDGQLHREDGPAIECVNGDKYWFQNGLLHRVDRPAIEKTNGTKKWYKNGQLHREDDPACEYANGDKLWYVDGKLDRSFGPAIEYGNGKFEYWRNGVRIFMDKESWGEMPVAN